MLQVRTFLHTPSIRATTYSRAFSGVTVTPFRTASTSYQYQNHIAKIWNSRNTDLTVRYSSARFVQQHIRNIAMASATSIYEFEPLNSAFSSPPLSSPFNLRFPSTSCGHPLP
ncbi:Glutathione peroxidase 2 [Clarireedia jacksonii]